MFADIPTPAVLVDRDRLERNLAEAQSRAVKAGVSLRPHVKTHRSLNIAQRQLMQGAVGITCAKPSEAQVFVDSGFEDVRIAYPVAGAHHLERLVELAQRARVSFCVDSVDSAGEISSAFGQAGLRARVLIKIDCGYGRAGWRWDDRQLVDVGRVLKEMKGLEVLGALTHAGQAYQPGEEGVPAATTLTVHASHERDRAQQAASRLSGIFDCDPNRFEVSIGSTPTFWSFEPSASAPGQAPERAERVSELRPGNYVFHDLTQVDLGVCDLDRCSLSVLTTIVSLRQKAGGRIHALVDAGKKTLTSDQRVHQQGFGVVIDEQALRQTGRQVLRGDWRLHALSEEHGWLDLPPDADVSVGDRIRIVMNHACVVVSTQRRLFEIDQDEVVSVIEVSAGGCSI